ncbi:MAG: peptidase M61, partial [Gammaproteobacteria bacterium]|nr:peptidase M61 [Gammaproteobacteria bacterium]
MSANSPANHYTVKPVRPEAHVYEVTLHIPEPIAGGQIVHMPAWIPGSYMIRDFAKNIVQLWAESEGRMLAVDKVDKQTWQVESCERDLCLRYEVYAWDLSVRAAHLDKTHAYFNGTSLFMAAQGLEDRPCTLELLSPDGKEYQLWKVATAMPRLNAEEFGFGTYQAANYDELIDHPVEIGQFDHIRFEACGVPHDVVITGAHNADLERIARDLKPICEAQIAFFGGKAPVDYYLFMVMVVGNGYGGLEHRASTSLLCSRDDLPAFSAKELSEPYKLFLGLCSHEYFHTWNVKRIKPEKFLPYDLRSESHTRLLWVFEGI